MDVIQLKSKIERRGMKKQMASTYRIGAGSVGGQRRREEVRNRGCDRSRGSMCIEIAVCLTEWREKRVNVT